MKPENAEEILMSNGEIIIPDIIAQEIGYKRLEKINKRGEELTEKLIAEYEVRLDIFYPATTASTTD